MIFLLEKNREITEDTHYHTIALDYSAAADTHATVEGGAHLLYRESTERGQSSVPAINYSPV